MFAATPTASKAPLSPDTPAKHKPILAERFKTKMCRTWTEKGECPYEFRCMFAHGEEDLRTKAMNLADGLTTDEAVRAFQYASAPTAVTPSLDLTSEPSTPTSKKPAPLEPSSLLRFVEALTSPAKDLARTPAVSPAASPSAHCEFVPGLSDTASEHSSAAPPSLRRFRHDPYAPVVMGPPCLSTSYFTCAQSSPGSPVTSPPSRVLSVGVELESIACELPRSKSPSTTYGAFASLPASAGSFVTTVATPARGKADPCSTPPRVASTYGPKTTYCAA